MLKQELVQGHTLCGWGLRVPQRAKPIRQVRGQAGRAISCWSAEQIEEARPQPGQLEGVLVLLRKVRRCVPENHVWVELPACLNPTTAAVYAAYLAEQGYEEAAGCMGQVSALLAQQQRAELEKQREREERRQAEERLAEQRRVRALERRQAQRAKQKARRPCLAAKVPPDVILIDSDYYAAEPGESQDACDAALERLLKRVKAEYPNATVIDQPEYLWQTCLAMRSWEESVGYPPGEWYEDSWK